MKHSPGPGTRRPPCRRRSVRWSRCRRGRGPAFDTWVIDAKRRIVRFAQDDSMPLITFRFEGLFTFVVRRNSMSPGMPNGVYALMPETRTFGHPHQGSIQAGAYSGSLSGDVNIRDVAGQPITVGPGPRIEHLLPLSRVNKVKIKEEYLTGDF